jgi:hypothetical protein
MMRGSPSRRPMMNWPSGESVTMHGMTFTGRGSRPGNARATLAAASSISLPVWM